MKQPSIPPNTAIAQVLRWLDRDHSERRAGLAVLAISLIYGFSGFPGAGVGLIFGVVLLVYFAGWLIGALYFIDARIRATIGNPRGWRVHTKVYPLYKFVDIYHGAQRFAAQHQRSVELLSEHLDGLVAIVNGSASIRDRRMNMPGSVPRKIDHEQEIYLPTDSFWLIGPQAGVPGSAAIVRVRAPGRNGLVHLEVAARRSDDATRILDTIADLALAHSIYRNRMIRVVFGPETRSNYGDDESLQPMDLVFYKREPIADDAIILDGMLRDIIEHTIVDFHQRHAELRQFGLPGQRGVLFYGPPGTGKTYTCKYIAQRLPTATTIVVTGHALLRMKAVCAIAKMLQPALVLLEDVDLVFAHRDNNAYNTVLGEFIDQLDGFGEHEQVIFILTTNAIERIESAIKDRPGRVSQCIYFGPPSAVLRRRYLDALVRPYDAASVDLERVVGQTNGVSQAFLKELVFRAVQIASSQPSSNGSGLHLTNEHFELAFEKMTSASDRAAHRIIGFRIEADH